MSHKIRIAACILLMIVWTSSVVFSQMSGDAGKEFNEAFYAELQTSEAELMQFGESLQPLFADMQRNVQAKTLAVVMERVKDTSSPMTPEEGMQIGLGIAIDELAGMQQPINEKATEFFSEEGRQKMHLRLFQLKEGLMNRVKESDNPELIQGAFGFDMMQLMGGYPDFLEFSPEQRELISKQQKETSLGVMKLVTQGTMKMITENPEKLQQIQSAAREFGDAKTDEEREEIGKKIQELNKDMLKDVLPEMKRLLIKGHEDFHRALTDAQKAKIKAVMAAMPDYMKKLLAEAEKDGGLSGLESWVPGAGVPGVNPNRETPRQRTNSGGGRAFPGD